MKILFSLLLVFSINLFADSHTTRTVVFNIFKVESIADGNSCIYYGTSKYTHKSKRGVLTTIDRTYAITDPFFCKTIKKNANSMVSCTIKKVTSEFDTEKESNLVGEGLCSVK